MPPRLRVLAGTSASTMQPITHLVNTPTPHPLSSELFEGAVVVHIKGLTDEEGRVRESVYFERGDGAGAGERAGVTWSIQVQGRFLEPHSSDDVLFGNTFDRPLKLPWGTGAVLKFMHYIDPTLEHDLTGTASSKPWALSPLIATMPHFMHTRVDEGASLPVFPPEGLIRDETKELYQALVLPEELPSISLVSPEDTPSSASASSSSSNISELGPLSSSGTPLTSPASALSATFRAAPGSLSSSRSSSSLSSGGSGSNKSKSSGKSKGSGFSLRMKDVVKGARRRKSTSSLDAREQRENELKGLESAAQRRSYFAQRERRREVVFGPEDVITTDFCYGFISFAPSLSLQLPGGLSFDLMKYWDGQPVRFVCCERVKEGGGNGEPWGRIFWSVAIEVVDE